MKHEGAIGTPQPGSVPGFQPQVTLQLMHCLGGPGKNSAAETRWRSWSLPGAAAGTGGAHKAGVSVYPPPVGPGTNT